MMKRAICAILLAGSAGCATGLSGPVPELPAAATLTADLRDATGGMRGTATLTQVGDGARLSVTGMNLPSGARGIHIHQTGVCAPPDFASAGPHWNPTAREHGKDNPAGMHMGDLPNLLIGADGRGTLEVTIPATNLTGGARPLLDGDGASLVIHAGPDDNRSDPSGNSGGRIACGVFR